MIDSLIKLFQNPMFSGVILAGLIGSIAIALKSVPLAIWNRLKRKFLFNLHMEESDELYIYFERWLKKNHNKQYRNLLVSLKEIKHKNNYNQPTDGKIKTDEDKLYYQQNSDTMFIRYKGKLLVINKGREKLEHTSDISSLFYNSFSIVTLFNKDILYKLMDEVVSYNQQFKPDSSESIEVYATTQYFDWMRNSYIKPKNIENVIINKELKESLMNDVNSYVKNKDWYERRSISYKRGYCFYGDPGNGKTSLALSLAKHLKRPVYILSLQGAKDINIRTLFNCIETKSILLIEDIDSIFDGRCSKVEGLSFSSFLQCLDGAFNSFDLITIITTNHIEKLDPALLRDGRIDLKINITNPNRELISNYINMFFETDIKTDIDLENNNNLNMAKIQNICINSKSSLEAFNNIKELNKK